MHIRHAEEADMPVVDALNDVVQNIHAREMPGLYPSEVDSKGRREILDKARLEPDWRLWVAEMDRRVVGYLATELKDKPAHALRYAELEGHVHHISVFPDAQRLGAGRALVKHAIDDLKARNADRITVAVWSFNTPSLALFRDCGFEPGFEVMQLAGAAR